MLLIFGLLTWPVSLTTFLDCDLDPICSVYAFLIPFHTSGRREKFGSLNMCS